MKSLAWHHKRTARRSIDGEMCVTCGACSALQVHHKTYDRLGDENVADDLFTLCDFCQGREHGRNDGRPQTAATGLLALLSTPGGLFSDAGQLGKRKMPPSCKP